MLCDDNNYDDVFVFPFFFFFFFMNGLTDWTLAPKLLKQLGAKKKKNNNKYYKLISLLFLRTTRNTRTQPTTSVCLHHRHSET